VVIGSGVKLGRIKENIMVHELVHSQDLYKADWKEMGTWAKIRHHYRIIANIPLRVWGEGRAEFARHLFDKGTPIRFDMHFKLLALGIAGMITGILTQICMPQPPRMLGISICAACLGGLYWPFNNVLCTLTEKVGDPVAAFRLSSDKIPKWHEILRPSRYCERVMNEQHAAPEVPKT
jgi:hypothetical protein